MPQSPPFSPTTCWPAGPFSLERPVAQPGGLIQPEHSPSHEDANSDCRETLILPHQRWRRDVLQPPEVLRSQPTRGHVRSQSGLEACDASHGIREGFLVLLPPHNAPGNRSTFTSHGWPRVTTSFVFKKRMGKMSFYKLFKYYSLNSVCLGHSR